MTDLDLAGNADDWCHSQWLAERRVSGVHDVRGVNLFNDEEAIRRVLFSQTTADLPFDVAWRLSNRWDEAASVTWGACNRALARAWARLARETRSTVAPPFRRRRRSASTPSWPFAPCLIEIAMHEAGHAVVGRILGLEIERIAVRGLDHLTVDPNQGTFSLQDECLYGAVHHRPANGAVYYAAREVMTCGGPAAELLTGSNLDHFVCRTPELVALMTEASDARQLVHLALIVGGDTPDADGLLSDAIVDRAKTRCARAWRAACRVVVDRAVTDAIVRAATILSEDNVLHPRILDHIIDEAGVDRHRLAALALSCP